MVEPATHQRRETGCRRHGDHDEGEHAAQRAARIQIAGDRTRQNGSGRHAHGLNDPPEDQDRHRRCQRADDAADNEDRQTAQHDRATSEAIGQRTNEQLTNRENGKERTHEDARRRCWNVERAGEPRQRGQQDVRRQRAEGRERCQDGQKHAGCGLRCRRSVGPSGRHVLTVRCVHDRSPLRKARRLCVGKLSARDRTPTGSTTQWRRAGLRRREGLPLRRQRAARPM